MKLSGVREDTHILKAINSIRRYGKQDALCCATAPLLIAPPETQAFNDWAAEGFSAEECFEALRNIPSVFTYYNAIEILREGVLHVHMYYRVSTNNSFDVGRTDKYAVATVEIFRVTLGGAYPKVIKTVATYEANEEGTLVDTKYAGTPKWVADTPKALLDCVRPHERTSVENHDVNAWVNDMQANAQGAIAGAAAMYLWAEQHDQYPVIQQSTKHAQRGTKPCKRRDLPRLIYMNKLPSPSSTVHQGGHHASPVGHERRGHYKTLRHAKYKHHPKYGVEKGIYVRPAWVGDKSVVREGNRYTVIT